MTISIDASFSFELEKPTDILLQFEAAAIPEQRVVDCNTRITETEHFARVAAHDTIGERIWLRAEGRIEVEYSAKVEIDRLIPDIATLHRVLPHDLPGEAIQYMFDSRYCEADRFHNYVDGHFGHLEGGARIAAMRDWIEENFTYAPGSSTTDTTALDSFVDRQGICRDYAHVMVTLARASGIPARFISCFDPGVDPQDFHAVAEVFLEDSTTPGGGAWYPVDATGMSDPATLAKIGVGRDAADVSFITSFGMMDFGDKTVSVTKAG